MNARLKIPPPLIALLCGVLMWWLASNTDSFSIEPLIKNSLIVLLLCLGVVFDFAALYSFRRAKTTINPMSPQRTSALVTTGIYRLSRNPMYVGLTFFLFAWWFFLQSLLNIAIVIAFIIIVTYLQIKPEEAILEKQFGDAFNHYKKQVRRWL